MGKGERVMRYVADPLPLSCAASNGKLGMPLWQHCTLYEPWKCSGVEWLGWGHRRGSFLPTVPRLGWKGRGCFCEG